jgi:hypothetical protein
MKTSRVAALSALTGVVIGAMAIQGLHAQAKPPAYVVVAIRSITDPDGLQAVIMKSAPQVLAAAGGHYVIRTNEITNWDPAQAVCAHRLR